MGSEAPKSVLLFHRLGDVPEHEDIVACRVRHEVAQLKQTLQRPLANAYGAHRVELDALVVFEEQAPAGVRARRRHRIGCLPHFQMNARDGSEENQSAEQASKRDGQIDFRITVARPESDHTQAR